MKVSAAILLTLPPLLCVPPFCDVRPPHPDSNLNAPKQALEAARQFETRGGYAEALERHEWFHENAPRIDPAMAGVRLSFALGDWVRLGKKHPPAMESLRRMRDRKTRAIRTGAPDEGMFQDVVAINQCLDERDRSTALFRALDQDQPEFAVKCGRFMEDHLLESGEYDLFLKYNRDVKSFLKQRISRNEERRTGLGNDTRWRRKSIQWFDGKLVETTLTLARLMEDKGDPALAMELKAMTAKTVSDPRLAPEN